MTTHHLPVRPNIQQLRHQAKDLLESIRSEEPQAVLDVRELFPDIELQGVKLNQAQYLLAKQYGLKSWNRLVVACKLTDAIWKNDVNTVRELLVADPTLLLEDARGVKGNWGPPMSYAANVGANEIVDLCHRLGASDVQFAFERACLRGKLDTAKILLGLGATVRDGIVMGPCETLNGSGLDPEGKHKCLQLVQETGFMIPKTAPMAIHCGRLDWLEEIFHSDPKILNRTYKHSEIFPLELGCSSDPSLALHGTPLGGAGLLHMAIDYDEVEIGKWLISKGCDANLPAETDNQGFGGQTPLFHTVVNQSVSTQQRKDALWARILYDDESEHLYRDVSPIEWGRRFHGFEWRNEAAVRFLESQGN